MSAEEYAKQIGRAYAKHAAEEESDSIPWWAPLAVGGALGLGTYGYSRIPKLVSGKRFPLLRKMQEMAKGEMKYHSTGLEDLAARGKELGLEKLPKRVLRAREGTHGSAEVMWPHLKPPADKTVFSGYKKKLPEGMLNPALGPVTGKAHEQAYNMANKLENKLLQAKLMGKHAPGAMPETIGIKELMREYNLPLRRGKNFAQDLKNLQAAARKHLGGDFYIKPSGARTGGDVSAASMGSFPSGRTDLAKAMQDWKSIRRDYRKVVDSGGDFSATQAEFSAMPEYKGRVVEEMLHNNALFQRKVPIKAMPSGVGHEYRVHTVGGRAVPSMAVPWVEPEGLMDVISQKLMARRAARFAQKQLDLMPEAQRGLSMGMDIVPVQGGGFKILELNPGGQSGFLDHPGAADKLYRAVTGRSTKEIAKRDAIRAGIGGAAATGVADVAT